MNRLSRFYERLNLLDETIVRVEIDLCYLLKNTLAYYKKREYLNQVMSQRDNLAK